MSPADRELLRDRIAGHFLPSPPERLGVAVSGGSDSLALLHLLHDWAQIGGPELHVVTVDHGLRPGSADEARQVAERAARLGLGHHCLLWQGWDGVGNLPDQARRARYDLMADWARENAISHIALGHTADDQAETFLMRLARQAGVDGLAAMSGTRRYGAVQFCRPALQISRQTLRNYLRQRSIGWIDDPSNEDERFERVRARRVLAALAPLGITPESLTAVAGQMSDVRKTLYWYVFLAAQELVSFHSGDILIARKGFRTLQREIARRLLQSVLQWAGNADYVPRRAAMGLLLESLRGGTGMTLHGCRVIVEPEHLRVLREHRAVADIRVPLGTVWDAKWRVTGPQDAPDLEIGALGPDGLRRCPGWRAAGLPEASQWSGPAIWQGSDLIAAPLAGFANGWHADLIWEDEGYFASLLSQ